VGVVENR